MSSQPHLDPIRLKAKAGDANAQAVLARALIDVDFEEAFLWMEKSAQAGKPEALYFLGVWHTDGIAKKREMAKGLEYLNEAEKKGLPLARHYLAFLKAKGIGGKPDWKGAVKDLIGLAKKDNPFAISQLGFLMRMTGLPDHMASGEVLIKMAAGLGNPQAKAVFPDQPPHKPVFEKGLFDKVQVALEKPPTMPIEDPKNLTLKPRIAVFPRFVSPEITEYLISRSTPGLKPSLIIDHIHGEQVQGEIRTSTEHRFLPSQSDLVIHAVCERIALASEEKIDQQETLGVLRYKPGQEYRPHSDFLKSDTEGNNPEVERSGQRIKTFLIYLNEEYEGGETDFPNLGVSVKGRKGDGVLFTNVMSNGEESRLSLHAGRPVISGEKFITTLWIRDQVYSYPLAEG